MLPGIHLVRNGGRFTLQEIFRGNLALNCFTVAAAPIAIYNIQPETTTIASAKISENIAILNLENTWKCYDHGDLAVYINMRLCIAGQHHGNGVNLS